MNVAHFIRPNSLIIRKLFVSQLRRFKSTHIPHTGHTQAATRKPSSHKRPLYWDIHPRAMETPDWLHIAGKYRVCPWSLSGVESCIVVSCDEFTVAFDMGYAYPAAVKCQHVFITHGHMDHIAAVMSHASKRGLYGMPPATYYVPPNLVQPLNKLAETFTEMTETPIKLKLRAVEVDEEVKLPGNILVKPFPTIHRVRSQGYIVYSVSKKLKPAYEGKPSKAIGSLVKDGEDIFDIRHTPLVAYTGDTISDIFDTPHNPDLLRVQLLITESTYVDNEDTKGTSTVEKARQRGHCHIDELIQREELFQNVQDILLVHFSDKYSTQYIRDKLHGKLVGNMKDKVHLGFVLKDKFDFQR